MEFLDIPLFDDDFYKMILRFCINLFFLTAIVKYIYHKNNENKDYFFNTYFYLLFLYNGIPKQKTGYYDRIFNR